MGGVHEVKPTLRRERGNAGAAAADAVTIGFALRLAARRLAMSDAAKVETRPLVVWCATAAAGGEVGRLYGPGLAAVGLRPGQVLLVETARTVDCLWAIEEALRSGAAALVLGQVGNVDLEAARRLSLAAEGHRTPCLLLTGAGSANTPATASRWRVGVIASAPYPLDPAAPGACRAEVALERCRSARIALPDHPFALEWCDETHRFRSFAVVGDRTHDRARQVQVRGRRAVAGA